MNKAKVLAENFIDFLAATPVNATAMEAQRTNPVGFGEPSHDVSENRNADPVKCNALFGDCAQSSIAAQKRTRCQQIRALADRRPQTRH